MRYDEVICNLGGIKYNLELLIAKTDNGDSKEVLNNCIDILSNCISNLEISSSSNISHEE